MESRKEVRNRVKSLFLQGHATSDFGFFERRGMAPALLQQDHQVYCQGGPVSLRRMGTLLAVIATMVGTEVVALPAQEAPSEIVRRAKSKVQPAYPELARKMNITGTVRIEVVVSPNGTVKDAKIVGGHPVLATAALEAAKKWRFEPAPAESSGVVDFKFEGHQ
jgi:TonB family protein